MRDQLRDRRTLLMIVGLPLVLYPLMGFAVLRFAAGFAEQPSLIGVVTGSSESKDFPPRTPPSAGRHAAMMLARLGSMPGVNLSGLVGTVSLVEASREALEYPHLIQGGQFTTFDSKHSRKQSREWASQARLELKFLDRDSPRWLEDHAVDLVIKVDDDFFAKLDSTLADGDAPVPPLVIAMRPGDDRGRLARRRIAPLLEVWRADVRRVRMARMGVTEQQLNPVEIRWPTESGSGPSSENVADLIVRVFPFLLVLWSLAGALYPAVDLCAGEKERGTMETLLITPAGREEIVLGKFLTIWVFSSGTALLNLLSMGISTAQFAAYLPYGGISMVALLWCVVLSLPQSAFFSALSLAIGAYARSSKEGQYYLMPLFVLTMPLIFLTLAPGVELNPLYSLVPVTGVALLMQRLMTSPDLAHVPWAYFVPVLFPIAVYSWLALRWAIEQFNREEVLFREAERLDPVLWIKSLFRNKEPLPTTGQAFFIIGLLLGLRWLSLSFGNRWPVELQTGISQLAFVAMPPIFMILLLNTQPSDSIYLRWPRGRETFTAAILALLFLPALTGLSQAVAIWFPNLLDGVHPLIVILRGIHQGESISGAELVRYFLAFALVPALCEEIAFRGFILRGLHHGFRPRNAVMLSSFFFALFHMNVFLFVPTFVFGIALGLMTVRSRSILPAILFHFLYNGVLIAMIPLARYSETVLPSGVAEIWPWGVGISLLAALGMLWWLYRKPYIELEKRLKREAEGRDSVNGTSDRSESSI